MSAYSTFLAGLTNSVSNTYSSSQTSALGRANQKTINSVSCIGPTLPNFIDVQTIAGFAPTYSYFDNVNSRLYVIGGAVASPIVALFNFSPTTGAYSYVGKVLISMNALANIFRGFKVTNYSGQIHLLIAYGASSVFASGVALVYGLSTSDFTSGGTALFAASTTGQKAVYNLQDPTAIGVSAVTTSPWGVMAPFNAGTSSFRTKIYMPNNTAASPQIYAWDLASGPPQVTTSGLITNGISSVTTAYGGTSPSAYFSMGASNNGYSATVGEQVIIQNGTTNVPTNMTQTVAGAAQTVYYMRDLQLVGGTYYFNLSATVNGAAIVPANASATFTMQRALAISTNMFYGKALGFTALTGAILTTNSVDLAIPTNAPINSALNGQDCITVPSSTNLGIGKISDIFNAQTGSTNGTTSLTVTSTSGIVANQAISGPNIPAGTVVQSITNSTTLVMNNAATNSGSGTFVFGMISWPSFTSPTLTGTGTDVTAPTAALATYSNEMDNFLYQTGSSLIVKKIQNGGALTGYLEGSSSQYLETLSLPSISFGLNTVAGIDVKGGWAFLAGSTAGQRGLVFLDLQSDTAFGYTSIITPILSVANGTSFKAIQANQQLVNSTTNPNYYIRNGASSGDAAFATATSGTWIPILQGQDLSGTTIGPYFQIKTTFQIMNGSNQCSPSQISDIKYTVQLPTSISSNWTGSVANSSLPGASPVYYAFRLATAYGSSVPRMKVVLVDDAGGVRTYDTTTNASNFTYSTNNGSTWTALGTVPNTALTTELRFQDPSPSGNPTTASIQEY